jgi:uncharacterized protein
MNCRCVPVWFAALSSCLAFAQPVWAETLLHLGETATVMVAPDEIAAALRFEVTSASAADAQARVNAAMQEALAEAHKVAGVTASTAGYSVWRVNPTPADHTERWQVSATLDLTGRDGPALLGLVGTLQQHGLVVGNLGWRLSRAAQQQARQDATKQALSALRGRAEEAAALLDLRFGQFKEVRLDSATPQPLFRQLPTAMAMSASPAPPPAAVAEDVPVSATADADAILLPR